MRRYSFRWNGGNMAEKNKKIKKKNYQIVYVCLKYKDKLMVDVEFETKIPIFHADASPFNLSAGISEAPQYDFYKCKSWSNGTPLK